LFIRQRGIMHFLRAVDLGMSKYMVRSRIESGRWERVLPRTYRLVGVAGSFEQQLIAAALWCGGVASHESAAAVWGLDGARKTARGKRRIEVTVDRGGSVTPVDWITVHRTNRALDGYRTMRHNIPVTSIPNPHRAWRIGPAVAVAVGPRSRTPRRVDFAGTAHRRPWTPWRAGAPRSGTAATTARRSRSRPPASF
jgi:hypothetical protein